MRRPSDLLALALGLLAGLQLLHVLDQLRTDPDASFPALLATPQVVAGVGGALVALVLVRRGAPSGRRLAIAVGVLVATGFAIVHGIPVATARAEPYWGDGSADAVQWIGVIAIWSCCAWVIVLARARAMSEYGIERGERARA